MRSNTTSISHLPARVTKKTSHLFITNAISLKVFQIWKANSKERRGFCIFWSWSSLWWKYELPDPADLLTVRTTMGSQTCRFSLNKPPTKTASSAGRLLSGGGVHNVLRDSVSWWNPVDFGRLKVWISPAVNYSHQPALAFVNFTLSPDLSTVCNFLFSFNIIPNDLEDL